MCFWQICHWELNFNDCDPINFSFFFFRKMAADIVSKLFEVDLDEVLREIFFSLDSTSLRSSRCKYHFM